MFEVDNGMIQTTETAEERIEVDDELLDDFISEMDYGDRVLAHALGVEHESYYEADMADIYYSLPMKKKAKMNWEYFDNNYYIQCEYDSWYLERYAR